MDAPNGGALLNTTIMRLVLGTFRTVTEQDCREIAAIVDQNRHAFSLLDIDVFKAAWNKDYIKSGSSLITVTILYIMMPESNRA